MHAEQLWGIAVYERHNSPFGTSSHSPFLLKSIYPFKIWLGLFSKSITNTDVLIEMQVEQDGVNWRKALIGGLVPDALNSFNLLVTL